MGVQEKLVEFVGALREAGVCVSVSETLDAAATLTVLGEDELFLLKPALRTVLVKKESEMKIFDAVYDSFFLDSPPSLSGGKEQEEVDCEGSLSTIGTISEALKEVLLNGGADQIALVAGALAGFVGDGAFGAGGKQTSLPISRGLDFYLFRALNLVGFERLASGLVDSAMSGEVGSALPPQLAIESVRENAARFRYELAREIRRRLKASKDGLEFWARHRKSTPPKVEEVDFSSVSIEQMEAIRMLLPGLSRKLAAKLARKHTRGKGGRVDFRSTLRHGLSYGGVPFDIKFKKRRPSRPDLYVLCDISGSVRNFSSFTLQLVYSLHAQFRSVRSFVFIDRIDEVTNLFRLSDPEEAINRVYREADVVDGDGHSDIGKAIEEFVCEYSRVISPRSAVLILSDGRNNSRDSRVRSLEKLREKTERIYWLNPEPSERWDTGDSVIGEYADVCKGVFECRNLKQLSRFISSRL